MPTTSHSAATSVRSKGTEGTKEEQREKTQLPHRPGRCHEESRARGGKGNNTARQGHSHSVGRAVRGGRLSFPQRQQLRSSQTSVLARASNQTFQ